MAKAVEIPFPLTTNPGAAAGEGSGRVINCYAYKDGEGPRWRALPGLSPFATIPTGTVRGRLVIGNFLYAVVGTRVVQVGRDGTVTSLDGQIAGSGLVTMARNNALIPDITITAEYASYLIVNRSTVVEYRDPNLPQVNSVAFLDGYFLWTDAIGNIRASGLNATTIDPLSIARAEARPDGLLRGVVYGQSFFALGSSTIEVWQDVGSSPFPLARSTVIPIGLAGQWAVAGYEDGWGGPLIFVADDGSVRRLDGYTPTRISSDDLERLIAKVDDRRTLVASVYTFGGNAIWSLSSPLFTWEYNLTTGEWHERISAGRLRWQTGLTVKAFGRWLASDLDGGALVEIDVDALDENGDPLVWGLDSGPVKDFPARVQCPGAAFDFVLGQAPLGRDPQVMLSWSHDGGATWSRPLVRPLGVQGKSFGRITVNRVGLSSHAGVRWRFRVSDGVYTSFSGGRMEAAAR